MKPRRTFVRIGRDVVMPMMIEGEFGDADKMMDVVREWVKERYEKLFRIGMANAKAGTLEVADVRRVGDVQYRLWLMPMDATVAVLTRYPDRDGDVRKDARYQGFKVTPQTLHVLMESVKRGESSVNDDIRSSDE